MTSFAGFLVFAGIAFTVSRKGAKPSETDGAAPAGFSL
jgi:hypothetical protein